MKDYYFIHSDFLVEPEIISQALAAFHFHCVNEKHIPYCSNDNQLLTRPIGEKGVFDIAVTKLREITASCLTTP